MHHVKKYAEIILGMSSANEMWCYNVTLSLIGWAHTQNVPLMCRTPSPDLHEIKEIFL